MRKKAVSPAHRRAVAQELVKNRDCSQRAACRILRLARSTFRYRGRALTPKEEQLRKRLLALSTKHPRYGYRRIAAYSRSESRANNSTALKNFTALVLDLPNGRSFPELTRINTSSIEQFNRSATCDANNLAGKSFAAYVAIAVCVMSSVLIWA